MVQAAVVLDIHDTNDITIKANRSLTTYKLLEVTYGNNNHFKSAMCLPSPLVPQAGWCEYDGQRGSKRISSSLLWNRKKGRHSLCLFPVVYPFVVSVTAKKL